MVINSHEHPRPTVLEDMKKLGIDKAVLLPGRLSNDKVLEMARKYPEKFVPFFRTGIADQASVTAELRSAVERGHRGIKFQPLVQHFLPNDRQLYPIYETAQELEIPVLFHTGVVAIKSYPHFVQYSSPLWLDEVAYDFPELKIVIAHMGGNYHYEALIVAEKHPNVYMDTAFLHHFCDRSLPHYEPIDLVKRAIKFIGVERILYAYEGMKPEFIRDADLKEDEKEAILWQNAARLLKIEV